MKLWIAAALLWHTGTPAYSQTVTQTTPQEATLLPNWHTGTLAYSQTVTQTLPQDLRTMQFHFERPQTAQRYTIQLQEDGVGALWHGPPDFDLSQAVAPVQIHASPATTGTVFAAAAIVETGHCDTHQKHLSQTGRKVLSLSWSHHQQSCQFNYSDSDEVNRAVSAFLAIAETVQIGDQLAHLHRFDRLGLDPEMKVLVDEAHSGSAIELENIAPTLQSIIDDDRVIDRVRREASGLLAETPKLTSSQTGK